MAPQSHKVVYRDYLDISLPMGITTESVYATETVGHLDGGTSDLTVSTLHDFLYPSKLPKATRQMLVM